MGRRFEIVHDWICRKQTILLLSERPRKDMEKLTAAVVKDCPQIEVLTRRFAFWVEVHSLQVVWIVA